MFTRTNTISRVFFCVLQFFKNSSIQSRLCSSYTKVTPISQVFPEFFNFAKTKKRRLSVVVRDVLSFWVMRAANSKSKQTWRERLRDFETHSYAKMIQKEGKFHYKNTFNRVYTFIRQSIWPRVSRYKSRWKIEFLINSYHSKCKCSSLRSQGWMRLFLWFSNAVQK